MIAEAEEPTDDRPRHTSRRSVQDALTATLLLVVLPFALGLYDFTLLGLCVYALLSGAFLTVLVWARERRLVHKSLSRDDLAIVALVRALVIFLVGGVFLIAGSLAR